MRELVLVGISASLVVCGGSYFTVDVWVSAQVGVQKARDRCSGNNVSTYQWRQQDLRIRKHVLVTRIR